jgi:RNA polymerase sigma factor FliA
VSSYPATPTDRALDRVPRSDATRIHLPRPTTRVAPGGARPPIELKVTKENYAMYTTHAAPTQTVPMPLTGPTTSRRGSCAALSVDERNALVESHLPQVRFIADRLAAKLPPSVEREDLIGAGILGLIDAASKFDPARGVLFKTYAEMRVRGAMLDSLRDLDWVPRSMRRRSREVEATYSRLQNEFGRAAHDDEVAASLGLEIGKFQHLVGELSGLMVTSFGEMESDGRAPAINNVPDSPELTPLALYERSEASARLAEAITCLPERERHVLSLYYVEELTMKEIGAVLGVTESRVSQIRTQAIQRLRAALMPCAA